MELDHHTVPRETTTAKYARTTRLGAGQKRRKLRLERCQWRALQTREGEVEHVSIGRTARLKGRAIEDREAKQVHLVIAAMDQDRWGSGAERARFQATRYRPASIDRNVAGVQEHAGSPAAIDGGSFKRRSKTYPAVAAGDRSAVVQDDVAAAAAARADLDTGSAVAANPETWVRDAWTTRETVTTCSSVNSDASCSGAGIATNSASANSTSAASATSAANSFGAFTATNTSSAVAAGDGSEIEDLHIS